MNKRDFRELFLNLTRYTIPFGYEGNLVKYLPAGYKKDAIGNYYYQIGDSETLFTTHLDTYSTKVEKVNHVFDENDPYIVGTDGTTILGGDNKLGCCILISMIGDRIPGTYYFFIGEEPLKSGGLYGSKNALKYAPQFFNKFKRCIAFDRKEYGSIVTRQMGRNCCSVEFASEIANRLNVKGIEWNKAVGYGYYTDTAVFMDTIPECTNLSAGGFNEHYKEEYADLNYTYNVYKAACDIDWETLPVVRQLENRFSEDKTIIGFKSHAQNITVKRISELFSIMGLRNTRNTVKGGIRHLTYSKWLEDFDVDIYLDDNRIIIDDKKMTFEQLKVYFLELFKDDIIDELEYYIEEYHEGDEETSFKAIEKTLKMFDIRYDSKNIIIAAEKFIEKLQD